MKRERERERDLIWAEVAGLEGEDDDRDAQEPPHREHNKKNEGKRGELEEERVEDSHHHCDASAARWHAN